MPWCNSQRLATNLAIISIAAEVLTPSRERPFPLIPRYSGVEASWSLLHAFAERGCPLCDYFSFNLTLDRLIMKWVFLNSCKPYTPPELEVPWALILFCVAPRFEKI